MQKPKPTWLNEPCPPWCTRGHEEDDHPEDRYHCSEPSYVAAIITAIDTVPLTTSMTGLDLTVRRGRYAEDVTEWVSIEPVNQREPRLVLTIDSAARLDTALRLQVK